MRQINEGRQKMKKILLIDDDISSLKGLQMCFSVKAFSYC